jgi:hypothetical protein
MPPPAPVMRTLAAPKAAVTFVGDADAGGINAQMASRLLLQTKAPTPPAASVKASAAPPAKKRAATDSASTRGVLLQDDGKTQAATAKLV